MPRESIRATIKTGTTITPYTVPLNKTLVFRAFSDNYSFWNCFDYYSDYSTASTSVAVTSSPVMIAPPGSVISTTTTTSGVIIRINGWLEDINGTNI